MPIQKEELQERAQLVRCLEAMCQIEHPSADELNLRTAFGKKLAQAFNLRELRSASIEGPALRPGAPAPAPASAPARTTPPPANKKP